MVARPAPSHRHVRRLVTPLIAAAAATPGADRYRKRFTATAHLWVLLLHVLWGSASLRQTHARLTTSPRWWQQWGMPCWISFSQLARSSTSRPAACAETLVAEAVACAQRHPTADPLWHKLRRVVALDSTFLRLSGTLCPWSRHGKFAPGMRLQCALAVADHIPAPLRLSLANINDHTALAQADLTPWRGWTVLCDLGYYGHQQFQRLRAAGVSFVTRLHPQASYRITAQRPVPSGPTPDGDVLLADWLVTLGSPNNRRGAVLPKLRIVISQNRRGTIHRFLTDRTDLTATEIVRLYRQRWQIELFFRWLKRQLEASTPLGHSRTAVWLTILLTIAVAILLLALDPDRPASVSRSSWLRAIGELLLLALIDDS